MRTIRVTRPIRPDGLMTIPPGTTQHPLVRGNPFDVFGTRSWLLDGVAPRSADGDFCTGIFMPLPDDLEFRVLWHEPSLRVYGFVSTEDGEIVVRMKHVGCPPSDGWEGVRVLRLAVVKREIENVRFAEFSEDGKRVAFGADVPAMSEE